MDASPEPLICQSLLGFPGLEFSHTMSLVVAGVHPNVWAPTGLAENKPITRSKMRYTNLCAILLIPSRGDFLAPQIEDGTACPEGVLNPCVTGCKIRSEERRVGKECRSR